MGPGTRRRIWLGSAIVGSLALLLGTGVRFWVEVDPWRTLLLPLNLGDENTIAAWWSGMLLLVSSLHAYDGSRRTAPDQPEVAGAWRIIAALLLFLSFDEVGSVHERTGQLTIDLGYSEWIPLGVLAVLLGGLAVVALWRLWNAPAERMAAVGIFLGFALLASIVPQEYFEHRVEWSGNVAQAARLVIEEGTELLGILVILGITTGNTPGLSARARTADVPFSAIRRPGKWATWLAVPFCLLVAVVTAHLPIQRWGHPSDWVAATAFLGAGLVLLRPLLHRGNDPPGPESGRRARIAGIALCAVASATSVATDPLGLTELEFYFNTRLSLLAVLCGLFALMLLIRVRRLFPVARIVGAVGLTFGVGLVLSRDLVLVYLFTQLVALVVLHAVTTTESG